MTTHHADTVSAFRALDQTDLPPIEALDGEKNQILWVLWIGSTRLSTAAMTPGTVSAVLRDVFGINVSWQKVEAVLSKEKTTVAARKLRGRRAYQIMKAGTAEVAAASQTVLFVDPE